MHTSKYIREVRMRTTGRSIDRASTYLAEVCTAAPVRSYCLTVQTDLIGPAALNGALPKHDDMQAVAFVPEMSHFVVLRGRIFVDQLQCLSYTTGAVPISNAPIPLKYHLLNKSHN
jgi:hypothetical protein